jgi:hypothetical protein
VKRPSCPDQFDKEDFILKKRHIIITNLIILFNIVKIIITMYQSTLFYMSLSTTKNTFKSLLIVVTPVDHKCCHSTPIAQHFLILPMLF